MSIAVRMPARGRTTRPITVKEHHHLSGSPGSLLHNFQGCGSPAALYCLADLCRVRAVASLDKLPTQRTLPQRGAMSY